MLLSIPTFFKLQLTAYQYQQPLLHASSNGSLSNEFSVITSIGIFLCSVLTLLGLTGVLKQDHTALVRNVMKQVMEGIHQCRKIDLCVLHIHMYIYKSIQIYGIYSFNMLFYLSLGSLQLKPHEANVASKQKQFVLSESLRNSDLDNLKSFDVFFMPQITLMCCGIFWGLEWGWQCVGGWIWQGCSSSLSASFLKCCHQYWEQGSGFWNRTAKTYF